MGLTELQVFSDYLESALSEVQDQKVELFNAATRNGLILRGGANRGYTTSTLKYELLDGLIQERDPDSTADVSELDLSRILESSVKVTRRVGPVNISPGLWNYIQRSPDEAGAATAQQATGFIMQNKLNTAVMSLLAATLNVGSDLNLDITGETVKTVSLETLVDASAKFGDRSQSIVCWVMHSKVWFNLVKAAITNSTDLFKFETINVMSDGLARPFIISDIPDLKDGSTYYTLGLTAGAAVVEENGPILFNTETRNLKANIQRTYQGEYDVNVALKGFKWVGPDKPSDAALASGANWTAVPTSIKDMAAVCITSQ